MKYSKSILIITLLGAGTLFARGIWEKKPFEEWTLDEAISVLSDSPWSQNVRLRSPHTDLDQAVMTNRPPREGSGTCVESTNRQMDAQAAEAMDRASRAATSWATDLRSYSIRYVSASPVRMAIARWAWLKGQLDRDQARSLVRQNPFSGFVVVALSASAEEDKAELMRFSTMQLSEDTYLRLKKSGRKIHAEKYLTPAESSLGEALFYFPSADSGRPLIVPGEGKITFHCRLSKRTELQKEFDLKKMVVDSELEL